MGGFFSSPEHNLEPYKYKFQQESSTDVSPFSSPDGNLETYKYENQQGLATDYSCSSAREVKDLKCYQHEFENPSTNNYSFSDKTVYIIKDKLSAESALEILRKHDIIYVDCEGGNFGNTEAEVGLVQIAISEECCFLFRCKCKTEFDVLKEVLESNKIRKVFHDCSGDVSALAVAEIGGQRGITVCNVEDTQIAFQFVLKSRGSVTPVEQLQKLSLANLYTCCFKEDCPRVKTRSRAKTRSIGENKWLSGTLNERMIKYAALHVLLLPKIFTVLKKDISKEHLAEYRQMVEQAKNWKTKNLRLPRSRL